jgi:AmmeMemoRadiSam system protein A
MLWRGEELVLGSTHEEELLRIARAALRAHVEGQPPPELVNVPPELQQPQGAFVTLRKDGELRGCVGSIWATEPLARTVQRMAAAAAQDQRFLPVHALELDELYIEVSLLSPLRYVDTADDIKVGRDGLYITDGTRAGLLLPQVASEEGWGREELLRAVCLKAGLREDAWEQGTLLFSFEARALVEGR